MYAVCGRLAGPVVRCTAASRGASRRHMLGSSSAFTKTDPRVVPKSPRARPTSGASPPKVYGNARVCSSSLINRQLQFSLGKACRAHAQEPPSDDSHDGVGWGGARHRGPRQEMAYSRLLGRYFKHPDLPRRRVAPHKCTNHADQHKRAINPPFVTREQFVRRLRGNTRRTPGQKRHSELHTARQRSDEPS